MFLALKKRMVRKKDGMTTAFTNIRDQEAPIASLTALIERRTIPHALLFTGINGIGKGTVAHLFAMAVNCHQRSKGVVDRLPCGVCRSCRRIDGGLHPDVLQVTPQGAFIRIDQIRALCNTLALKPYEASMRLAILHDAQMLNPEASNALLKVLEEPPEGTVLILTATQTSDLLPTIVSRCSRIRFNPLRRETIVTLLQEGLLRENQQIAPDSANALATMAGGSYAKAIEMASGAWAPRRRWVIESMGLLGPMTMARLPICHLLAFAEQLVKAKAQLDDALELIKSWLRDLVVVKYAPEKVLHQDLMAELPRVALGLSNHELLARYDAVEAAQRALKSNANARLCIETLVLRLGSYLPLPPLADRSAGAQDRGRSMAAAASYL
jgi:DNA polymerase-3 subunit delta'